MRFLISFVYFVQTYTLVLKNLEHVVYSKGVQQEAFQADMTIFKNKWQQMWMIGSAKVIKFFVMTPADSELI